MVMLGETQRDRLRDARCILIVALQTMNLTTVLMRQAKQMQSIRCVPFSTRHWSTEDSDGFLAFLFDDVSPRATKLARPTMNTQFTTERPFITSTPTTPTPRGRPRGAVTGGQAATGTKRGRKPRGALPNATAGTSRPMSQDPAPSTSQPTPAHWAPQPAAPNVAFNTSVLGTTNRPLERLPGDSVPQVQPLQRESLVGSVPHPQTNPSLISVPGAMLPVVPVTPAFLRSVADEDADGDDELLPAMADDDYSAQLSWQSQSKDNLKCDIFFQYHIRC
jgi:hypothetical protein